MELDVIYEMTRSCVVVFLVVSSERGYCSETLLLFLITRQQQQLTEQTVQQGVFCPQ